MSNLERLSGCFREVFIDDDNKKTAHTLSYERRGTLESFLKLLTGYSEFLERLSGEDKEGKAFNANLYEILKEKTINILLSSDGLSKNISPGGAEKIRFLFRESVFEYIFKSDLLRRFYEKPRGYPGDYMMFEMIYDQYNSSKGIGAYFDKFIIDNTLSSAVINRKEIMKKILAEFFASTERDVVNIANLGCGGCRELREFFSESRNVSKRVNCSLVDQDMEGLALSEKELSSYPNVRMRIYNQSVIQILGLTDKKDPAFFDNYDLIYSMGLIDYFLNSTLERFIEFFYNKLRPGGTLVVASCDSQYPEVYLPLGWFCDWNFYKRDAVALQNFFRKFLGAMSVEIIREENGHVFFLIVKKLTQNV
ncbi:MAG: hypothetical protein KAJ18_02980 [Candidatus Omnitrophica bacterium]|nr:hypothetical protein [Candidatus Omnitrophota bacterium]